jgi:hypothetical protein
MVVGQHQCNSRLGYIGHLSIEHPVYKPKSFIEGTSD